MGVGRSEEQDTSTLLSAVTHLTRSLHQPGQPEARSLSYCYAENCPSSGGRAQLPGLSTSRGTAHGLSQAGGLRSGGLSPSLPRKLGAHSFLLQAEAHASQNPTPPQWARFSFWATGSSGLEYLQVPRFSNHLVWQTVLPLWAALVHTPV